MHSNLSPELNATIKSGEESHGINITTQPKGSMFEVVSGHTKYTIVVADPKKQEVAMMADRPDIEGTDIWYLMGAGWGGSVIKVGYIVVGAQMRMRRLSGGLIETSPVRSVTFCDDSNKANHILKEAESRRPQIMTEQEEREYETRFEEIIKQMINKEFPDDTHDWILELVGRFGNIPAKGTVMGVLCQAQRHHKLNQARELLERDFRDYWYFQPPSIAGDPEFMPLNTHRWNALYQELGVPLPSEDK